MTANKNNTTPLKNRLRIGSAINSPVFRMAILIVGVLILGSILKPGRFVTERNFQSIFKQLAEYGIMAVAVFICMLSGGIDLSVVYISNLSAIIIGNLLIATVAPSATTVEAVPMILLAVLAALVIGALCGLFNGFLVGKLNVPAMLATLGTGSLFLGISTVLTGGKALSGVPSVFTAIARVKVLSLPITFLFFLACVLIMGIVISRTTFGLRVQMIGTNAKAARFSGVDCVRDIMKVYVISGLFASVAGVISLMRMSSAKPDYGTSYIMFSILICVFGGTNPDGGKGSVMGVLLATIVLQMVSTLMNMFNNISAFYRDIVWGALLIVMLIVNYVLDTRKVASR